MHKYHTAIRQEHLLCQHRSSMKYNSARCKKRRVHSTLNIWCVEAVSASTPNVECSAHHSQVCKAHWQECLVHNNIRVQSTQHANKGARAHYMNCAACIWIIIATQHGLENNTVGHSACTIACMHNDNYKKWAILWTRKKTQWLQLAYKTSQHVCNSGWNINRWFF